MAVAQFGMFSARRRNVIILTYNRFNLSAATAVGTDIRHDKREFWLTNPFYSVHDQIVGFLRFRTILPR